jgi:uncharacterized damage-inducible protein DinB
MLAHHYLTLKYTHDSNQKIFALIRKENIQEETILRLASHIALAQKIWWMRVQQEPVRIDVWNTLPIEESILLNEETSQDWLQYLDLITEADLLSMVPYHTLAGELQEKKLETIIQHLAFHGTYHRGQLALLLKSYVPEIPSTDFIRYSIEI